VLIVIIKMVKAVWLLIHGLPGATSRFSLQTIMMEGYTVPAWQVPDHALLASGNPLIRVITPDHTPLFQQVRLPHLTIPLSSSRSGYHA
jgi:hypothetical protein